jgi:hypothetical protein
MSDESDSFLGVVVAALVVVLLLVFIGWVARTASYSQDSVFAAKEEALRRSVVEESKAYNDGMAQDIQRMEFEYLQADDRHKLGLGAVILHRTAAYNLDRLPPDERAFVLQLRHERGVQ